MKSDSAEAREQVRERREERPLAGKPAPRGPMTSAPAAGGSNAFADALKGKFGR
jgi:uncharacterized protein